MTLQDISDKITSLTNADTNQYPNAERLIDLNIWQQKIVGMILDSQDEADFDDANRTDYPIETTALTTNRDYSIPQAKKVLKFKDVSVCYDGVNVYQARPLEFNEIGVGEDVSTATVQSAKIDSMFSRVAPRYDIKFNSIFLYPRATSADVASGGYIVIEWFRQAIPFTLSDLTTGTYVPGFDDTFHAMLAYGASYEYCVAKSMPQKNDIARELQIFEDRLRKQYSSKQLDRKYSLSSDYQSYK